MKMQRKNEREMETKWKKQQKDAAAAAAVMLHGGISYLLIKD